MKKKIIMRGLFGLPTGIAIGFVITLIISACIGNGSFYPVTPELIDTMGNELNAVILQTVLCAIMGVGFAAASVIWELDSWSLLYDYQCCYATDCLCYELDEAYHPWCSLLCGNICCHFRCRLAFAVSALETEDKEDECSCQQRRITEAEIK